MVKPVIIGISGPELTDAERDLFEEHNPLGGRVKRLIAPTFYDAPAAQTFVDVQECKQNYSHIGLPIIDTSLKELEDTDFKVFKELAKHDNIKLAMTAHIIYKALDSENPATLSKKVIDYIKNNIGFKGLIISDAIDMKALSGSMADITKGVLDAGVDIVFECTGEFNKMSEVLRSVSEDSIDKFSDLLIV